MMTTTIDASENVRAVGLDRWKQREDAERAYTVGLDAIRVRRRNGWEPGQQLFAAALRAATNELHQRGGELSHCEGVIELLRFHAHDAAPHRQ